MADKQYEFATRLADLVAQAQISGNKVHESDIKEFFEDLELDDAQFDHIFAYLTARPLHSGLLSEFTPSTASTQRVDRWIVLI